MKHISTIVIVFFSYYSFCQVYGLKEDELIEYNKIISEAEFGDREFGIKKWDDNLYVYLNNPNQEYLVEEFYKLRDEINILSNSTKIIRVQNKSDSNFIIYFSDRYEYHSNENQVPLKYLEENWGFFWLYWNSNNIIYRGSMYVDVIRIKSESCKKHVLREELTQSLGMMNDIDKKGSIFNKNWECTITYSEFDKRVIKRFLSKER